MRETSKGRRDNFMHFGTTGECRESYSKLCLDNAISVSTIYIGAAEKYDGPCPKRSPKAGVSRSNRLGGTRNLRRSDVIGRLTCIRFAIDSGRWPCHGRELPQEEALVKEAHDLRIVASAHADTQLRLFRRLHEGRSLGLEE